MPTGYTHKVQSGECTSLREFALSCARAMGALIMMRDDPADAPVPMQFDPDIDHYEETITEYRDRLAWLETATPEMIEAKVEQENAEIRARNAETVERNNAERERYLSMISKVDAWEGAPEGLKAFMLQQLLDSMEFDVSDDPLKYASKEQTVEEWVKQEADYCKRMITSYTKYRDEEIERTKDRNEWLAQLFRSLEGVE